LIKVPFLLRLCSIGLADCTLCSPEQTNSSRGIDDANKLEAGESFSVFLVIRGLSGVFCVDRVELCGNDATFSESSSCLLKSSLPIIVAVMALNLFDTEVLRTGAIGISERSCALLVSTTSSIATACSLVSFLSFVVSSLLSGFSGLRVPGQLLRELATGVVLIRVANIKAFDEIAEDFGGSDTDTLSSGDGDFEGLVRVSVSDVVVVDLCGLEGRAAATGWEDSSVSSVDLLGVAGSDVTFDTVVGVSATGSFGSFLSSAVINLMSDVIDFHMVDTDSLEADLGMDLSGTSSDDS
jgi:hypothetical protein